MNLQQQMIGPGKPTYRKIVKIGYDVKQHNLRI